MQKQRQLQGSLSRPQNLRLLNVFKVPEDPNGVASLTLSVRVTVDIFENPRGSEGSKATTATRIVTPTPAIRLAVEIFHAPRESEGLKARTAMRIATLTPATVGRITT